MLKPITGYRLLVEGEIIKRGDFFNPSNNGCYWNNVEHGAIQRIGTPWNRGLVQFITIAATELGNITKDGL